MTMRLLAHIARALPLSRAPLFSRESGSPELRAVPSISPGARLRGSTVLVAGSALLAACAAHQSAAAVAPDAPGFWLGVWHGFIFPVAAILSIFLPDVSIYAVPNNGGWYDAGYFVGIVFLGVGSHRTKKVVVERRVVVKQ